MEPEEKPEVKPVRNRPPLNMLGDTLDDRKALSGETPCETRFEQTSAKQARGNQAC